MIDIHCHLIPGIDDGARTTQEALDLIAMAAEDGIKRMVFTPHIHFNRFHNTKQGILEASAELQQQVADAGIDIQLAAAAEVRIDAMMLPLIERNQLPFLGEAATTDEHITGPTERYFLLELPHSHIPPGADKLVKWLISQNIRPVIPHPERNRDILKNPDLIKRFARMGCYFQMTANALTGAFGDDCQLLCEQFLKQGLIHCVASDAHNGDRRPPILSGAYERVCEVLDESHAHALFVRNPGLMTDSLFSQPLDSVMADTVPMP